MQRITLKDLRTFPLYEVFGTGNTSLLRWVAWKLPNHHWTVYIGSHYTPDKEIVTGGNTIPLATVKIIIECDEKVLERYKKL